MLYMKRGGGRDARSYLSGDLPAFTGRNVPIKEIASAIGKDAQYVRLGIQQGLLKFGTAIKVGSSNEFSYYCPDKKFGKKQDILTKKQYSKEDEYG